MKNVNRIAIIGNAGSGKSVLLLDEITNNIDFETHCHVIDVLKAYLGAIIVAYQD